jgi:excisionase family DNA binding protein
MESKNNYYSKLELGMALNVCLRTIDNWISKGMISYSKLGKRVIFSQRDVDEFLEHNRITAFAHQSEEDIIELLKKNK